jgi:type II secretory pathway component PulF
MPLFHYQALDADGKSLTGDLEANSVQHAVSELQARGLNIQSIGLAAAVPLPIDSNPRAAAPPTGRTDGESLERNVLRSHMATILARGRAISPALRAYAQEMQAGWQRRQLVGVCNVLERGDSSTAANALADVPECWIPLLGAATTSPDPGRVLVGFLTESRRADDLRQKWWLTLAYPLILLALAVLVMTVLSIFLIPAFGDIFAEFRLKLPDLTTAILGVGSFMAKWGIVFLVVISLMFVLLLLGANRLLPAFALAWISDWIRPPFSRRTALSRFARFTADLLEAGVSLPDSLRIAGFTVNQSRMQRAAWQLANKIEAGEDVALPAFKRPLTATVALALAPETNPTSRVRLLREVSNCHAERVQFGLSWATGIVEPLAICIVGFVVGCTVLALFSPLIMLVQDLSQ